MPQSQHTQGPWLLQSDAQGVYGIVVKQTTPIRTHQFIATLHDSMGEDEKQANANLIAAAPDMLEALEGLYALQTCFPQRNPIVSKSLEKANAAIAKAKGEL